ncbi:MAG: laminin B domain-containing protein [Geitlerinemataceae cyanobacterium]
MPVISEFNNGIEGWKIQHFDGSIETPTFNSDGYIQSLDSVGGGLYFYQAPDRLLGDLSEFWQGYIGFDLAADPVDAMSPADIILGSDGVNLGLGLSFMPSSEWQSYKVKIDVNVGWRNLETGAQATEQEIFSVLSEVKSLQIRGDWSSQSGTDASRLDNVFVSESVPEPGSALAILLFASGYCIYSKWVSRW